MGSSGPHGERKHVTHVLKLTMNRACLGTEKEHVSACLSCLEHFAEADHRGALLSMGDSCRAMKVRNVFSSQATWVGGVDEGEDQPTLSVEAQHFLCEIVRTNKMVELEWSAPLPRRC